MYDEIRDVIAVGADGIVKGNFKLPPENDCSSKL